MEMFVSAITGDLISRLISFMVEKCRKQMGTEEKLECLQRVLLRIHTIVEEAEGRHITNQGMLLQLKRLMESMYRGYYMLDTVNCQALDEEAKEEVNHFPSFPSINPTKRLCLATRMAKSMVFGSESINKLQSVLESLETSIASVREFVILLGCCPRMSRQPYSAYLSMDKCMFSRRMERERIINFLLHKESCSAPNAGVLPIIGPRKVGKKTLIEHVCNDDRVRNHFSLIMLVDGNDLESNTLTTLRDYGEIKHQNFMPVRRCLLIIEFGSDVDEVAWRRFYSSTSCMANGSKIIVMSRMEEVATFGTTEPIRLKHLTQEEYWYFFKVLCFGSTDPKEYPELVSFGMEIATELKGSFLGAHIWSRLVRTNLNAQFWFHALTSLRDTAHMHFVVFGDHPEDCYQKNHPFFLCKVPIDAPVFLVYGYDNVSSTRRELPEVTAQDLLTGKTVHPEVFEVLGWRSPIPPYRNYIASCVKEKPPWPGTGKKRRRRRDHCYQQSNLHPDFANWAKSLQVKIPGPLRN